MAEIIKTWPGFMTPETVRRVFRRRWDGHYYFTLGRGKPQQSVTRIWMTHQGVIVGSFAVHEIVQNNGTNIPKLRSLDGSESDWQIKRDAWVAICTPPCTFLQETIYFESFRGWRYFELDKYRNTAAAKMLI